MSSISSLATEYAEALFFLAAERGIRDTLDLELSDLATVFRQNAEIRNFFASPGTPKEDKVRLIQSSFQPNVDAVTVGFLHLLVRKGREMFILKILDAYQDLVDQAEGKVEVQVTSAIPLSEEVTAKITAELTKQVQKADGTRVDLQVRVDPGLIGGLTVRMGDRLLDTSLRTRLRRLREVTLHG